LTAVIFGRQPSRQPEPLRVFLLETSVLERLSGPLCAAVTGRADSQRLLE
jgi:LuxR family transcriptional regulator, maltose regulon positive regulatory protein